MKKWLLIVCISFIYSGAIAQEYLGLELGFGRGWYDMSGIKARLDDFQANVPLLTRTENFPDFYNYDGALIYTYDNQIYGLRYRYMSTGARLSAADYSGFVVQDISVIGRQGSFFALIPLSYSDKFRFDALLEAGVIWTKTTTDGTVAINDMVSENILVDRDLNGCFELGPRFSYYLTSRISLNAFASYSVDLSKTFGRDFNRSNWSGLRAGISTSVSLFSIR